MLIFISHQGNSMHRPGVPLPTHQRGCSRKDVGEDMENWNPHTLADWNMVQSLWQIVWKVLKKIGLPYDPAIPVVGIHPKEVNRCFYIPLRSSPLHNSQKVAASQVSVSWWMGKWDVLYSYNGCWLAIKRNWNIDIDYSMDDPWQHRAEWKEASHKGCHTV